MLSTCTSAQKPFAVYQRGAMVSYSNASGDSPEEACLSFVAYNGFIVTAVNKSQCTWSYDGSSFPILAVCQPAVASPFHMTAADGTLYSLAIIGVWVSALVARWLIRVVKGSAPEPD